MTNVNNIQQIYNRLDGKNIIAVASGKGGVGKTWLSITLAQALVQREERVLLFDCDLGLANIDIQLGINVPGNLDEVLQGKIPMNQAVYHDETSGFDVLSGHSGAQSLCSLTAGQLQLLRDDLYILAQHYDRVVLDLGSGIEKAMTFLGGCCGSVLIICNDEPTSLADAYAFIKILSAVPNAPQIRVVVNGVNTLKEGERTFQTLAKACQNFLGIEIILGGILHQDSHVKECIKMQTPLLTAYPNCVVAEDIMKLVAEIKNISI